MERDDRSTAHRSDVGVLAMTLPDQRDRYTSAAYVCAQHGALKAPELSHESCDVILFALADDQPIVCHCECFNCKRQWWLKDRPVVSAGRVVRAGDMPRRDAQAKEVVE